MDRVWSKETKVLCVITCVWSSQCIQSLSHLLFAPALWERWDRLLFVGFNVIDAKTEAQGGWETCRWSQSWWHSQSSAQGLISPQGLFSPFAHCLQVKGE